MKKQYQGESQTTQTFWHNTPEEAWKALQALEPSATTVHMPGTVSGDIHCNYPDGLGGYVDNYRDGQYYAINWRRI